jgi:hypothetical protein
VSWRDYVSSKTPSRDEAAVKFFCGEMHRRGFVTFVDTHTYAVEVSTSENVHGILVSIELISNTNALNTLCNEVEDRLSPPSTVKQPGDDYVKAVADMNKAINASVVATYDAAINKALSVTNGQIGGYGYNGGYTSNKTQTYPTKNTTIDYNQTVYQPITKADLDKVKQEIVQQVSDEVTRIEELIERLVTRD